MCVIIVKFDNFIEIVKTKVDIYPSRVVGFVRVYNFEKREFMCV